MLDKIKLHKKKILAGVAILSALAAYLVGDLPLDAAIRAVLVAVGLAV